MSESLAAVLLDAHRARRQGPDAVQRRQRARIGELVSFARRHSPYFRELYRELPERVEDPRLLPVTNKKELMAHFDDWVTDRAVTIQKTRAFVDDISTVGERFLGSYTVATTSGTSGILGVFLLDEQTMTVTTALNLRMLGAWLDVKDLAGIVAGGGRMAAVVATGSHFAGAVGVTRMRKRGRLAAGRIRAFSVHRPLPELVEELNRFRPALLVGYASSLALLASEQEAGRLRTEPVLVQPSGETLGDAEYRRIATAFGAKVRTPYAATECLFIAYSCEHGWQHVNTDWAVLEPVDADYRPTPPGEESHTVLLSNLANRIQPILRYDLGDSVLARPDPCPCGRPLPAVRVRGRAADVLTFPGADGEPVTIPALVFSTLLDGSPGVELFQLVQISPTILRVRLLHTAGIDADRSWAEVQNRISRLLFEHHVRKVRIERADEPPRQSSGGKYRPIST
jgi:phenylacetate-coenzyme A ligase PaaK-like adenylate-forming protein